MALPPQFCLLLLTTILLLVPSLPQAQADTSTLRLVTTQSLYPSDDFTTFDDEEIDGISGSETDRRSLHWIARHYYISYGALSANRIPCPARSGRSYYTHNCYRASGPVRPYTRGCSAITRCRI